MNALLSVTVFVTPDDLLSALGHRTDCRARSSDGALLTVAVIAAGQFANHPGHALCVLRALGSLSGPSPARVSIAAGIASPTDSASCAIACAKHSRAVRFSSSTHCPCASVGGHGRGGVARGRERAHYCAATQEKFFGGRLHRVVMPQGIPVAAWRRCML